VVTLNNETLQSNTASYGGGVEIDGGTVTLCTDTVQFNTATVAGGGIYIISPGVVYIDSSTAVNTTKNTPDNIVGPHTSIPNCSAVANRRLAFGQTKAERR
jgi:hypothetical protein